LTGAGEGSRIRTVSSEMTAQMTGNYEFLGVVERPRVGVTYKVRNRLTGELETLRALPGASYCDPEMQERFLREIKMHTRLSHPNIEAFHDVCELDGRLVMTTEFVEGATLAALCARGPMPCEQAVRTIDGVLAGLEEGHALGILHRGITAEHVRITPAGEVKLSGFGLAKPATDVNLTQAGAVLGDVRYMSPEQVKGAGAVDGRADLYSVGVLLFQALTGKVPFEGANDFEIMAAQVSRPAPRAGSLNPEIAPELEETVLTALAKNPAERFADAKAFRAALQRLRSKPAPVLVREAAAARTAAVPEPVPESAGGRRTAVVVGGICVLIGLVVLLIVVHGI
jgi:eukaryotic-like serine/threonine-protein kinase